MKILVQNLQKKDSLATSLLMEYDPDVMLAQEINLKSETRTFQACNVSSMGYGTAISSETTVSNIKLIDSPYAEFGGVFRKKTTVATTGSIQFVSFHGYNGQPFKSIDKLVAHVQAVLSALDSGPTVFAGDFNTWSQSHLNAVSSVLEKNGFHLSYSWPYPGRDFSLDHAFLRDVKLEGALHFKCASDHFGALLQLDIDSRQD